MITACRLLKHLWNINKWEAFVLCEFILFVWMALFYLFHQYIQHLFNIEHNIVLSMLFTALIADGPTEFIAWLLEKKFTLPSVVAIYSKTTDPVKKALGNLIDHFISSKPLHNLYGNLMFFKLKPAHFPISRNDIGTHFTFIRHKGDFFKNAASTNLGESLKDFQIEDFSLIQSCIKKSWYTVAYGDISVLLQKKEYITKNIEMIRNKVDVKRLFIFPYWNGTQQDFKTFKSTLNQIKIDAKKLSNLIVVNHGRPDVNNNALEFIDKMNLTPQFNRQIKRALVDAIFLFWLVKLHEHFDIQHKILARDDTKDGNQIDIIEGNILRKEANTDGSWKDEGSALIDNSVIIRFDDKIDNGGYIIYEFISLPDEAGNYKKAFETIWSNAQPVTRTIDEILNSFFSETTVACLKKLNTQVWINLINKELKK